MRHYIITGASRGIGEALAKEVGLGETTLHLVSRGSVKELMEQLSRKGTKVYSYAFDLSRTDGITILTEEIFSNIDMKSATFIALVNNAGMLEPIGPIGKHDTQEYRKNLEVNFVAPALLCHEYIKRTAGFDGKLRILNVSSGASQNAYYGWSHYCSTKAGLDMITAAIAVEHRKRIGVFGFNPGRTDTNMQDQIREQSPEDFEHVQSFIDAWEQGNLNSPEKVAKMMRIVLDEDRFESGTTVSTRDFS